MRVTSFISRIFFSLLAYTIMVVLWRRFPVSDLTYVSNQPFITLRRLELKWWRGIMTLPTLVLHHSDSTFLRVSLELAQSRSEGPAKQTWARKCNTTLFFVQLTNSEQMVPSARGWRFSTLFQREKVVSFPFIWKWVLPINICSRLVTFSPLNSALIQIGEGSCGRDRFCIYLQFPALKSAGQCWRDGSVVKIMYQSSRGAVFNSYHSHSWCITASNAISKLFEASGLCRHVNTCACILFSTPATPYLTNLN